MNDNGLQGGKEMFLENKDLKKGSRLFAEVID